MQRASNNPNIIKASQIPENYKFQNMQTPEALMPDISAKLEKAREYDRLVILLKAAEKHYENMVKLTKNYICKEMNNPIDYYNKGTLLGYEDVLGDIRVLLDTDHV